MTRDEIAELEIMEQQFKDDTIAMKAVQDRIHGYLPELKWLRRQKVQHDMAEDRSLLRQAKQFMGEEVFRAAD